MAYYNWMNSQYGEDGEDAAAPRAGISALTPAQSKAQADAAARDALAKQILGTSDPTKWTGEGFGSAEKNAANMAEILSGIGITDISQFGKIQAPVYDTYQLQKLQYDDGSSGDWGYFSDAGESPSWSAATPEMLAAMDANNTAKIQTGVTDTYGNKVTGQAVGNTYGERQTGDAWGGTYAGSGNTGYRVQFDAQGNPHFYTTGQSSSNAADYAPLLGIASLALGLPGILGGALNAGAGLGLSAAAEAALGGALTGGAISGVTGGDVLKGAVLGGLGGYAQGSGMFGGAPTDMGPTMAELTGATGPLTGLDQYAGIPVDIGAGGGSPYAGAPEVPDVQESVFNPGPTYNAGEENVFNPGASASEVPTPFNAQENVFDPSGVVKDGVLKYDVVMPSGASEEFFPSGGNANPNLTPAAIESGLGSPGYGVNAGAMASGLFNPATIGAGAAAGAAGSGISNLIGRAAVSALLGGGAKAAIDAAKGGSGTISDGGGGSGSGPLSGYNFNPSMFRANTPDPAMFRPTMGVTTVADAIRQAARPVGMAQGGSTKPAYSTKAQLASMSPWARAAAELNNAAYVARMPAGLANMPKGNVSQLGSFAGGGGISDLGSYSDGGHMLKGGGDGMSDSIPATINGNRPARLADGEFVIPADVVSGLGNGSTDAGARQLYKMMDRVRQARTGTKKQGKEINAQKHMPV